MGLPQTTVNMGGADIYKMIDANAITAASTEVVWTPASGKTVILMGWCLSSSANAAIEFVDSSATTTVIAQTPLLAAAGVHTIENLGDGLKLSAGDGTLNIDVTADSTVSGMVWGREV